MADFSELSIDGRVATPEEPDWDEARLAWNLALDQRPEAVAFADSAGDVAAVVRFAADHGLRVAAQGTGHGAAPLAQLDETVLLKTSRMREVEVDPEGQTARVEAGVIAAELGAAAGEHGLCFLPGSAPDVGVVGFSLGGGLSWLGRRHGFACNRVQAIELVTAAGEQLTVDAGNEEDLFWALRGGGGGYAVVTALHVRLLAISDVFAGAVLFPAELGADAVRAYRDWAAGQPDELASVIRFITPPDMPDVPEPLRGTPLLTIDGAFIGDREEGEAAFAPMRELGEPIMDTFEQMPPSGLSRIHMDPEQPVPGVGDGLTLRELPDEAIEAWTGLIGPGVESPLLLSEIRQLGGALARPAEDAGALSKLDAGFLMYSVGISPTPQLGEAIAAHVQRIEEAMAPWRADGTYFNFSDAPIAVEEILPADVCSRLAEVKRKWDPEGRIVANHALSV